MSPRDHSWRSILHGEVIKQPNRIAHPTPILIREGRHIGVKRLRLTAARLDTPGVEATELETIPEDKGHPLKNLGELDEFAKHPSFVHQIRESPTPRLLLELGTSLIPLDLKPGIDRLPELDQKWGRHQIGKYQEPLLFELALLI